MDRHPSRTHFRFGVTAIVAMVYLLAVDAAMAHGGHEHPAEGGSGATVLVEAGAAALAIGIAYLAASAVYRWRDARRNRRDGS